MTKPLSVGLIGLGTAGRDVARAIGAGEAGACRLSGVLVRDRGRYAAEIGAGLPVEDDADAFFARSHDVVVETAGHGGVQQHGDRALRARADLMVVSVGAFCDPALYERCLTAAREAGRRLILPSAAIAGLDRIAAAAQGPMEEVRLTSRKPVQAWRGTHAAEKVDLDGVAEPTIAFEGPAREAARLFPESVNVSAALSLAGIGFERTQVRVVVDPTVERNVHEVYARGAFGEMRLEVRNVPSPDNPKTGYIVAMSVARALKALSGPLLVGL